MALSEQTLHPLKATSVELPYSSCLGHPLRCIATRYVLSSPVAHPDRTPLTLLVTTGISLNQETWLPVIKDLYWHACQPSSPIHIESIWTIERPNHGEAAILNEKILKEHYSIIFPGVEYAACIRVFLASDTLSERERKNLVGIGHSGGGGSLIQALPEDRQNILLRSLILVESGHVDIEVWPHFLELYEIVRRSNARRRTSWSSKDEAMKYIATRAPWTTFHPDVLDIIRETYFRPIDADSEQLGGITTKTTVAQETASFVDNGTQLAALPYLRSVLDILPTHLILGSSKDIWTPGVYKQMARNIEMDRPRLASVTAIEGTGHYVPAQKPEELAVAIFRILSEGPHSARSRL